MGIIHFVAPIMLILETNEQMEQAKDKGIERIKSSRTESIVLLVATKGTLRANLKCYESKIEVTETSMAVGDTSGGRKCPLSLSICLTY